MGELEDMYVLAVDRAVQVSSVVGFDPTKCRPRIRIRLGRRWPRLRSQRVIEAGEIRLSKCKSFLTLEPERHLCGVVTSIGGLVCLLDQRWFVGVIFLPSPQIPVNANSEGCGETVVDHDAGESKAKQHHVV
jgi:hypothetical protein